MRNTLRGDETMSEALARVGRALDRWAAEQRLREWAKNIAADPPARDNRPILERSTRKR
jgi:hypothetical protein